MKIFIMYNSGSLGRGDRKIVRLIVKELWFAMGMTISFFFNFDQIFMKFRDN